MAGNEQPPSLEELDARLQKARSERHPMRSKLPASRLGQAMSVAVEMAAAIAVGGVIGWLLDWWLDTRPWLLVGFLMVGIAGGVLNAYRASRRIGAAAEREAEKEDGSAGDKPSPADEE